MNIITRIRKSYFTKGLAVCLAMNMLLEFIYPISAIALTSGPSQPEIQSFEPVETTDMVNLFTGDFTYNIPLMNVPGPNGGYPINLAYHGGVSMDQEASWVGLGWNINAGAINRTVRGVPDDFDGDAVKVTMDIKDNWTLGLGVAGCVEFCGADNCEGSLGFSSGLNFTFNNYKGFGYSLDAGIQFAGSPSFNTGLSLGSDDGVGVNASMTLSEELENGATRNYKTSVGFNSKRGLEVNTSSNYVKHRHTAQQYKDGKLTGEVEQISRENYLKVRNFQDNYGLMWDWELGDNPSTASSGGQSISFSESSHSPALSMPMNQYRLRVSLATGASLFTIYPKAQFSGFFDTQRLRDKGDTVNNYTYGYENMFEGMNHGDFSRSKDGNVMKTTPNLAIPQLTYDYYSIQGQGVGGSFRPYRNEVGRIYNPLVRSFTLGGFFNFDAGGLKAGWGGGATTGYSTQRSWDNGNESTNISFSNTKDLWELQDVDVRQKEKVYYKSHGEKTTFSLNELDYIGGTDPVRPLLWGNGFTGNYKSKLPTAILSERDSSERIARNNLIHKLTNAEITHFHPNDNDLTTSYSSGGDHYLHEYEIFYYDWATMNQGNDPDKYLNRRERSGGSYTDHSIDAHNAGFKVLDHSGSYYVYGLPTYNNYKVENTFSINAADYNSVYGSGPAIFQSKEQVVPLPLESDSLNYKHSNTLKFLNKTETPPYAYSYLMTSILGSDYVDVDNNGPSDADKGYWVKFDYVKYADKSKWRAPYSGCMYNPGKSSSLEDDMGSYSYGEKEVWYLSRIQTSTHIVIFELSERNDNIEANSELNQESDTIANLQGSKSGLKIDKITLYEKSSYESNPSNAIPIQEVHFEYDYSLCQGVPNNNGGLQTNDSATQNQGGKLTLKKVWFTFEGNGRGALNPYVFDYDELNSDSNPDYSHENYDRWGNYKPSLSTSAVPSDTMRDLNQNLPYVHQYHQGYLETTALLGSTQNDEDSTNKSDFQETKNNNVSSWSLKKIHLPSGGEIEVEYESDDYAYVQDERATQMTYITKINDNTTEDNFLYKKNAANNISDNEFSTEPEQRRVYFKLEHPLPDDWTDDQYAEKIYDDYVRDIIQDELGKRNAYFKIFCKLKGVAEDYVSGYVPLEDNLTGTDGQSNTVYHYGVDKNITSVDIDGVDSYTHGFVTLECAKKKNGDCYDDFHPFALLAWQHIRASAPELLSDMGAFTESEIADLDSDKKKAKKVKNLFGWIPELAQMFMGYKRYCYNHEYAQEITLYKSMIRLTSPDRVKYGGGLRVKQIEMSDNWDDFESSESEESYGQVYDYTTSDTINGEIVYYSSGVAQYEPMIGGDEIALRYPRNYPGKIPFKSNNNLFFEHPVNESFMPAPIVGYSKVTVSSLNTHEQIEKGKPGGDDPDFGRGTVGVKEYQFYTAKDFPVLTDETHIAEKHFNVPLMIPFIASYTRNKLGATQGYKIELNDMHGKMKSISDYGLDENYVVKKDPISKTTFRYSSKKIMHHGKMVNQLVSKAPTLVVNPSDHSYSSEDRNIGMEYEFFTDQRHNKNATLTMGFNFNLDGIVIGGATIPIPSFWGTINSSKNDLRTFVTNKVINRTGLIEEIETVNEHYIKVSRNVLYDRATGRPVLTSSKNEFDSEIYNLKHPAHWEYEGMGQAYQNINLEFEASIDQEGSTNIYSGDVPSGIVDELVPVDAFIIHSENTSPPYDPRNYKATYISKNYGTGGNSIFYCDAFTGEGNTIDGFFKVYRSGRRNHYMTDAGNISMIGHPFNNQNTVDDDFDEVTGTVLDYDYLEFDNVLNASAVIYRDNWENENHPTNINKNPYATGEQGIWRAYKSLFYNGERSQDKVTGIVVSEDGLMDNVPWFNWQVVDFEKYRPLWQWSSEVTRYNDFGYEIENIDRLGVYSAALFGYNKAFVIGVGGNAQYEELGAEDFERFTVSPTTDDEPEEMSLESNLNFYETGGGSSVNVDGHDQFNILGGEVDGSGPTNSYVIIDIPHDQTYWSSVQNVTDLALIANFNSVTHDFRLFRTKVFPDGYDSDTKTILNFAIRPDGINTNIMYLPDGVKLSGKVTTYPIKSITQESNGSAVSFTSDEAHSGSQCMKLGSSSTPAFTHGRLSLIANKEYTLSCWIKRDSSSVPFYDTTGLIDIENVQPTTPVNVETQIRSGRIVNGWQKVEIDFMSTTGGSVIRTTFNTGSTALYVDDIRIAPKVGGIMTYVYDPNNFRLVATLNANNYATYYFYDEQGNLYLTKQETEEGIFTISESHGYMKPTAQN